MWRIVSTALLAAAALSSSAAGAQQWRVFAGSGGYYPPDYGGPGNVVGSVCSGQRARGLEARLGHEAREGELDGYSTYRIHQSIDRLEARQRRECAEGDWRSIVGIAHEYDRIGQWIDRSAHGPRPWGW